MDKVINKIKNNWHKNEGVSKPELEAVSNSLNVKIPEDYGEFLQWSNGGEGAVGENYFFLWKLGDLLMLNKEYQIQKYLSDKALAIGTDGGGMCYGYLFSDKIEVFKCPLGDLDFSEVTIVARSITDFFEKAFSEEI